MARQLTIGQLAAEANVPTSTVRYYERAGLLRTGQRSASNYRLYSLDDLHRLRFIRAAQATGFTLQDIAQLLRPAPCRKVQDLIEARLTQVTERMGDLRHVKKVLKESLAMCRDHEASGRCEVVDTLTARAKRH